MKLLIIISILLIFPAFSQKHFIEYQIGANVSAVISPEPLHRHALLTSTFGTAYHLELEKVSFSIGLNWQPRGYAFEISFYDDLGNSLGGNTFRREKMNYLNSEFLVSKSIGERNHFVFGTGLSLSKYLYSVDYVPSSKLNNGSSQPGFRLKMRNLEPWDFGLIGRIGYMKSFSDKFYLFLFLDYVHGLAKINYSAIPNDHHWSNRMILIRFVYGFSLTRKK